LSEQYIVARVASVARACNFHAYAIRHIRHLLTTELALTLACSLILSYGEDPHSLSPGLGIPPGRDRETDGQTEFP